MAEETLGSVVQYLSTEAFDYATGEREWSDWRGIKAICDVDQDEYTPEHFRAFKETVMARVAGQKPALYVVRQPFTLTPKTELFTGRKYIRLTVQISWTVREHPEGGEPEEIGSLAVYDSAYDVNVPIGTHR